MTKADLDRIPASEWTWYGHAAHFICGRWCRFHLATTVGRFLISTIGEYVPTESVQTSLAELRGEPLTERGDAREVEYLSRFGFEKLGSWGTYETLVFPWSGRVCDTAECACGLPSPDAWNEADGKRYDSAKDARAGHYAFCEAAATGRIGQYDEGA